MLELVKRAPTKIIDILIIPIFKINFINISNKYNIPTRIFIQIFKSIIVSYQYNANRLIISSIE